MNPFSRISRCSLLIAAITLAAGLAWAVPVQTVPTAATQGAGPDLAAQAQYTAALLAKGEAPPVAAINKADINGTAFYDILLKISGRATFDQVVELSLAQQAAIAKGVSMEGSVHQARMTAEIKRVLDVMNGGIGTQQERERALTQILQQRGMSAFEFRMWMETNAAIGQIIGAPASTGLERTADARTWLDKAMQETTVIIGDDHLAALYAAPAAPPKFTVKRTQPDALGGAAPAFAVVTGKDINRGAFNSALAQVAGLKLFQQVLDLTIVNQASVTAALPMDAKAIDERVQKELDRTLATMPPDALGAAREKSLTDLLATRHISPVEFRIGLETAGGLRALVQSKLKVTDDEIKEAWLALYGERRTLYLFRLPAGEEDATVTKMKALLAEGRSPAMVASELRQANPAALTISRNAANKELLDIIKATYDLKKPGEMSGVVTVTPPAAAGGPSPAAQKFVVLLEKIEEDRTPLNPLNDALRAETEKKVHDLKEQSLMNNELLQLRSKASVEFKDPVLKGLFDQAAAAMRPAQ
jgi:hypothetical protein